MEIELRGVHNSFGGLFLLYQPVFQVLYKFGSQL